MGNALTLKQDFGLILSGSVIFTVAFLWRDMFNDLRQKYFPKSDGLLVRFAFTVLISILLLLLAGSIRNVFGLRPSTTAQQIQANTDISADGTPSAGDEIDGTTLE